MNNKKRITILISSLALIAVVAVVFVFFIRGNDSIETAAEPDEFAHLPVVPGMVQPAEVIPPVVYTVAEERIIQTSHMLEDLDYFLYVLENNFCLFDVAHWAHGTDIRAVVDSIRSVMNNPYSSTWWYLSNASQERLRSPHVYALYGNMGVLNWQDNLAWQMARWGERDVNSFIKHPSEIPTKSGEKLTKKRAVGVVGTRPNLDIEMSSS